MTTLKYKIYKIQKIFLILFSVVFDRVECHVTAQRSPLWYIIRSRILVYSYCILLVMLVVRNYHNPIIV